MTTAGTGPEPTQGARAALTVDEVLDAVGCPLCGVGPGQGCAHYLARLRYAYLLALHLTCGERRPVTLLDVVT